MTTEKCSTCKHSFTTGKYRLYCKKSLANKYDCGEYEMAIETLSNSELDKIRAEIEKIANEEQKHDKKWAMGLQYAVKIIDKYRESEGSGNENQNNSNGN